MELSTILLETASSKLFNTASSLQCSPLTENNSYFLFCMFFAAWLPWRLSLEFRLDRPVPSRWWLLVNVVLFWIMGHYFVHWSLPDCIPDDYKHTWMALPGAFVHCVATMETPLNIIIFGLLPLNVVETLVIHFRDPAKRGASSYPRIIWVTWCFSCHWLWLISSELNEPRDTIVYASIRYALGVVVLSWVYRKCSLCDRGELIRMILGSALPLVSDSMGRSAETALWEIGFSGLGTYLVGYSPAMAVSFFL